jgi:hypothetical protein
VTLFFLIGVLTGLFCGWLFMMFYSASIGRSLYKACKNLDEQGRLDV